MAMDLATRGARHVGLVKELPPTPVKEPKRSGKFQPQLTVKPRMSFIIWVVQKSAKIFRWAIKVKQ